jgi:hypothetical protein
MRGRVVFLSLAIIAVLTGLKLVPADDDALHIFPGAFHFLRWVKGEGPEGFSRYVEAACEGDETCGANYHAYHVRFAVGFAYPLRASLYAGFAEIWRRFLPPDTPYAEIFIRAGNAAIVAHWLLLLGAVGWALSRIRDQGLRGRVAAALAVMTVFDYLVYNNWDVFSRHRLFTLLHDGSGYALTIGASRSAVAWLLGLYLGFRLLEIQGRLALVPLSLAFHLAVSTVMCGALFLAEAIVCALRRTVTRDVYVLGVVAAAGLAMMGAFGSSGYFQQPHGFMPSGVVLGIVVRDAVTRPGAVPMLAAAMSVVCAGLGTWAALRRSGWNMAMALWLAGIMGGLFALEFSAGRAISVGLLRWDDNPAVHSVIYIFRYAVSPALVGVSLWTFSRHRAAVPAAVLAAVFVVVWSTSPVRSMVAWRPSGPVGEPFAQIWRTDRWYRTYYHHAPPGAPAPDDPHLTFADRTLWVGQGWWFNALIHLRALHQWAATGHLPSAAAIAAWPPRHAAQHVAGAEDARFLSGD